MRTRSVLQTTGAVVLAAASSFVALAVAASCIIPDQGIVVLQDGFRWCANAEGALGWDNNPNATDPILGSGGLVVQGCSCFDDEEHALLERWEENGAPSSGDSDYDAYVLLRDEILLATRTACVERADALGFLNNNCITAIPDDDDLFSNGNSEECSYEALAADTDGGTDTDEGPRPFDLSTLSCGATACRASRALVDDMFARPEAFLLDDTRIEFDADGTLAFSNVSPGDVAYIAGIRSRDRLLRINGQDATSLDQVANLLLAIRNDSRATITLRDRYDAEVTISLDVF